MTLAIDTKTSLADFMAGVPGIYRDVPDDVYRRLDACSFSRLKNVARSPAHCRHAIDHPQSTPAMMLGTAAHTFVLQSHLIDQRYTLAGPCSAMTSGHTPCRNGGSFADADGRWFCGTHKKQILVPDTRTVLSEKDFEAVNGMRLSIFAGASFAADIINYADDTELSIVWRDEVTGVLMKGRIDALTGDTIGDLKTCEDARPDVFSRKLYALGYHLQAGCYVNGAQQLGLPVRHFALIAIEKKAPFGKQVYRLKDSVIEAGLTEARRLMLIYSQCQESGEWPAYADTIEDLDLPAWDWKKLDESEEGS